MNSIEKQNSEQIFWPPYPKENASGKDLTANLKRWKTTKTKVKSRKSTGVEDYKNGYEEEPLLSKHTSFSSFYKFEEDLD